MIEVVNHNGVRCYCDGMRQHDSLVFLSLFGPQNAVRSVWAVLVGRKQGYIEVGHDYVRRDEAADYVTLQKPLRRDVRDMMHLVMLHPAATNRIAGTAESFYVLAEDAKTHWRSRFNRLCRVPVKKEWLDDLWVRGLASDSHVITALDGFGVPGYYVGCNTEKWHKIVCDLLGVEVPDAEEEKRPREKRRKLAKAL